MSLHFSPAELAPSVFPYNFNYSSRQMPLKTTWPQPSAGRLLATT
jgi:hypothetical protein